MKYAGQYGFEVLARKCDAYLLSDVTQIPLVWCLCMADRYQMPETFERLLNLTPVDDLMAFEIGNEPEWKRKQLYAGLSERSKVRLLDKLVSM